MMVMEPSSIAAAFGQRALRRIRTGGRSGDNHATTSKQQQQRRSVAALRREARSLHRLLARLERAHATGKDSAPARGIGELRLRAAAADRSVEDAVRAEREKKITLRYKRVRIFERVKLARLLKRVDRKRREVGADERLDELHAQLASDLEYAQYFPKGNKYVSLFRNGYRNYSAIDAVVTGAGGSTPAAASENGSGDGANASAGPAADADVEAARTEIERLKRIIEEKKTREK